MWFIFALLSAVFGGLQSFAQKVVAHERHDTSLISATSALISSLLALVFFLITAPGTPLTPMVWWLGLASGFLFIGFSITRLESLQFIDAAIFFPLYKVLGPALVALIGIFLLGDQVGPQGVLGIALSCMVPLLLLSKHENHRQNNLKLGLLLLLASTVLSAIAAGVNALVVQPNADFALPLVVIANGFAAIFGFVLFFRKHKMVDARRELTSALTPRFLWMTLAIGLTQLFSFYFLLLAIAGDSLSLVYSINAHYILIPVLLSVWFYKEHWNKRKAAALIVSLLALVLLHR